MTRTDDLNYWPRTVIAVSIVGTVVATLSLLLRLYSRRLTNRRLDVSDLFMNLGFLVSYGVSICGIIAAFNGLGRDVWSLPQKTRRRARLIFWLEQKFWPVAQVFVKLSIIMLLRKAFGSVSRIRTTTTCLIIFTVAWGTTAIVTNIFQCWPVQHFWIASMEGHCIIGQTTLFIIIGSFSLVEDVVLLLFPVVIVWRSKMAAKQKTQLTVLFSVVILVCVFSLLRVVEFRNYVTENLTLSGSLETIWTQLELDLAIACASVVLMRPLLQRCFEAFRLPDCLRRKLPSSSAPSSGFMHIFQQWPYAKDFSNFSQDACTEVRAQAYHTPTTLEMREQNMQLEVGGIVIVTTIDQYIQDRGTVLASVSAEAG